MNENELFEAIGEADEEMLSAAEEKHSNKFKWAKYAGIAAAVCFVGAGVVIGGRYLISMSDAETTIGGESTTAAGETANAQFTTVPAGVGCDFCATGMEEEMLEQYSPETRAMLLSCAAIPEMPAYPNEMAEDFETQYDNWDGFIKEYRNNTSNLYSDSLNDFTQNSMSAFLTGGEGENRLFSPVNVYLALGMLAETADGDSRQQILDLTGAKDIDTLREYSNSVWKRNYSDDGAITSLLSNSLWLSDTMGYNADTVSLLSRDYYADVFSGNTSDEAYTKALQEWLSVKTGGMLENEAKQVEMNPETAFTLASTVYFRAKWFNEFDPENTEKGIFNTSLGEQVECDFMKRQTEGLYYWSDNFGAICMNFDGGNAKMWLFLPDEGATADEILESGEIDTFFEKLTEYPIDNPNSKFLNINISMPKFDTSYTVDLKEGLSELGVTDVFDSEKADFSSILSDAPEGTALSKAQHSVRIAVDEEGCTASAFTAMMVCGAAMPPDEIVDFTLDRPFIFVIKGVSGDPLFTGVINNPTA